MTGNTVIDALLWTVARERGHGRPWREKYAALGDRRMVLITGHRRENFGDGMEQICTAILILARRFPDVEFLYPVHLNPNVREPVGRLLSGQPNIHLCEPAPYPEFVWLMDRSTLILTDSGGVQEEAPSLRKPVLVMRETTERPEAVEAGAVELVGTDVFRIVDRDEPAAERPGGVFAAPDRPQPLRRRPRRRPNRRSDARVKAGRSPPPPPTPRCRRRRSKASFKQRKRAVH